MSAREREERGLGAFFGTMVALPLGLIVWAGLIYIGAHVMAAIVGH